MSCWLLIAALVAHAMPVWTAKIVAYLLLVGIWLHEPREAKATD